jgi:MGT family glycosyltransferase
MSDLLMATWHGAGTTPPLMSVARALVARGHTVRVLADELLRPEVEATGAEHLPWTTAPQRHGYGRDGDFVRDWEAADPAENFARLRDRLAIGPAALFAADVRAEIRRRRPDAVLTELLLFGPLVAAEAEGVPAVVLNPTINVIPAPGVPPFGFGFDPAVTDEDRERDRVFGQVAMEGWDAALPALNDARAANGLAPLDHVLDQGRAASLVLVLTSDAFDLTEGLPPVVRHVGPRLDDPAWAAPWEPPPGDEPLVLVATSSDYQGQEGLLARASEALGRLPVRGVVTTGRGIAPASVPAAPGVQVVESAPHSAVLREARAVVTHCGHGSAIKTLAAGVPMVCVPLGRDQGDIAARVVRCGAGVRLAADASADEIAAAVRAVLDDPSYAAAARRVAARIAEETARDRAVELIEEVVGAGVPA